MTTQRSDDRALRAREPVTEAEERRVIELHGQGLSRAAIAREVGRAPSTVGRIASAAGIEFDRSKTKRATEAKRADNRSRRADLISGAYSEALKILRRMAADQYDAVGTDVHGVTVVTRIRAVPARDLRYLANAWAQLTNGAARLEALDDGSGLEEAKGIIGAFMDAVTAIHGDGYGDEQGQT